MNLQNSNTKFKKRYWLKRRTINAFKSENEKINVPKQSDIDAFNHIQQQENEIKQKEYELKSVKKKFKIKNVKNQA